MLVIDYIDSLVPEGVVSGRIKDAIRMYVLGISAIVTGTVVCFWGFTRHLDVSAYILGGDLLFFGIFLYLRGSIRIRREMNLKSKKGEA